MENWVDQKFMQNLLDSNQILGVFQEIVNASHTLEEEKYVLKVRIIICSNIYRE